MGVMNSLWIFLFIFLVCIAIYYVAGAATARATVLRTVLGGDEPGVIVDARVMETYGFKYIDWSSDKQIATIANRGGLDDQCRLLRLLGRYLPHGLKRFSAAGQLFSRADREVYDAICKRMRRDDEARGIAQATEIYRLLNDLDGRFHVLPPGHIDYLDVGCGDGAITAALHKLIEGPSGGERTIKTYCMEPRPRKREGIEYGGDWPNEKFDLITAFMVLHHVGSPVGSSVGSPVEGLDDMLKKLHRMLKTGGHFFIKEHDITSPAVAMLVDVEHAMFVRCAGEKMTVDEAPRHYMNMHAYDNSLEKFGFKKIWTDYYYTSPANRQQSATRAWCGLYKKM